MTRADVAVFLDAGRLDIGRLDGNGYLDVVTSDTGGATILLDPAAGCGF